MRPSADRAAALARDGRWPAGYLLGSVSGSGVASTVTLGAVAWPMLRRPGYSAEVGGAMLAAAGIGAILSPPAMGAAAFLIAEFLNIPFLRVAVMATVPALLYYASILFMIELESRRMGTRTVDIARGTLWPLTRRYGLSLRVAGGADVSSSSGA